MYVVYKRFSSDLIYYKVDKSVKTLNINQVMSRVI